MGEERIVGVSAKLSSLQAEVAKRIADIEKSMESARSLATLKVVPLVKYPETAQWKKSGFDTFWSVRSEYVGQKLPHQTESECLAWVAKEIESANEVHDQNKVAIARNKDVVEKIAAFMSGFGLSQKKWVYPKTRKGRSYEATADWLSEITSALCPSDEPEYLLAVQWKDRCDMAIKEHFANKARAKAESDAKTAAQELWNEAVAWLVNKGKVMGKDFNPDNAIAVANEIAGDEEVDAMKKRGEYMDFDGANCDGPCKGWMPGEHRCQCGNRRVSFTTGYGHSFKNPVISAEAY